VFKALLALEMRRFDLRELFTGSDRRRDLVYDHPPVGGQLFSSNFIGCEEDIRVAMTGVARFGLGRVALDIMGRGVRPGFQLVEIQQQVLTVILVAGDGYGNMANWDVTVRSLETLDGVATDEESLVGGFRPVERITGRLTYGNMAAVATGIGDRMADLAGQVSAMHLVHDDAILSGCDGSMTGFTAGRLDS
jgi:hypothetical protein